METTEQENIKNAISKRDAEWKEAVRLLKDKLKKAKEGNYPIVALDNTFEIINEVFGEKLTK